MNKASSTILATAGLTVGMLGFALPASAATAAPSTLGQVKALPPLTGIGGIGGTGGQTGDGKGGQPGWEGMGGGKTPPNHYWPQPEPAPTCHPQPWKPKHPGNPFEYNRGSDKNKGYATALYSWQHPKSGHYIKCDPKPAPVKNPAPPKHHHHHAPRKHWWQSWF